MVGGHWQAPKEIWFLLLGSGEVFSHAYVSCVVEVNKNSGGLSDLCTGGGTC